MVHTIRLDQKFDFNYVRPSWHLGGQPNDSLGLHKSKGWVWAKAFFSHKSAGMFEIRLYWVKSNA